MVTYGSITDAATGEETGPISPREEETSPLIFNKLPNGGADADDEIKNRSFWSQLVFGWLTPLLALGNDKKKLETDDLKMIPLPSDCQTDYLKAAFDKAWKEELKKSHPNLLRALFRAFGFDYLVGGFVLKLTHDLCIFVGPQVLNGMILFLKTGDAPVKRGLYLTLAVTISQLTMSFCLRHYFFKCYLFGLRIRTAVVAAVYKKALVLDAAERQARTLGEITNLMTIDAQKLQDLTSYLHAIWYSFVQIALAIFFLWQQLGPSCLGGVAVIVIMIPVTKEVAKWMGGLQKNLMKARDERVDVNSEVLGGMKVIKMQAWEGPFQNRIMRLRNAELTRLWNYILASCISTMLWSGTPLAVALATFASYVLAGNELDVATALTSLALFDIIRFPLFMLPNSKTKTTSGGLVAIYYSPSSHPICVISRPHNSLALLFLVVINRIVEAGVSLTRVRSFLLCDEHHPVGCGGLREPGIYMENVTAVYESTKPLLNGSDMSPEAKELADKNWEISLLKAQLDDAEVKINELSKKEGKDRDGDEAAYLSTRLLCLSRINFECRPGQLIAVVGGVGCGK